MDNVPVPPEMGSVVEGKLFPFFDGAVGEEGEVKEVAVHAPSGLEVGGVAVIEETEEVALFGGVDGEDLREEKGGGVVEAVGVLLLFGEGVDEAGVGADEVSLGKGFFGEKAIA